MDLPSALSLQDEAALSGLNDADGLAAYLRQRREQINAAAGQSGGLQLARAHSDLVDSVMRRTLSIACGHAGGGLAPHTVPIAMVATGGYGRREVCPYSDIDITFIPQRDGDPLVDHIIKEMFTLVMRVFIDSNGLDVGYAYRLLEDCEALDHQTTSGLLDARLLAGSPRVFIAFEHEFWVHFNPAEFIFAKLDERRKQQARAGGVPRVVEPDIKDGAGGLRDLHAAVWVTQARRMRTAAQVRGERAWHVLERDGGVSAPDVSRLRAAHEFLLRTRSLLHVATNAGRDQLVVTRQEEIAERLGYAEAAGGDGEAGTAAERGKAHAAPPVERFMRDYYEHAAAIHRIAGDVMRRAENGRMLLGIGLDCSQRRIEPANPALAHDDPVWMLWACELAQKYGLEFGDELGRVIRDMLEAGAAIGDEEQAAEVFTRIVASPRGAWPILQQMADLGILGWLLPPVGAVMDLIPYDPSHDYTVGQHTLYVIRNLDGLRATDGPEEGRDFRLLMQELPNPEQLYLAALLHDAGKVTDERPHAETGAEMAERVCRQLRWDAQATANVVFLVRHHLLMAETSRLRDLNLDETIRDFAAIVDDVDRLHMLYLLTFADTSAVGQGVWTQVKGRFLRDLLRRSERAIAGEEAEEYDDAMLARTRRRLLKELQVENLPPQEVAEHVESMPATYILNTDLNEMALHIGFVRRARQGDPVIDFHDERDSTFSEVVICTLDDPRPGLLSKIAGVFYAADLNVHSAQIFTRVAGQERIAIDSFFVDFRGRRLTPGKRKEVAANLGAVLTGCADVADVLAKRRKPSDIGGPVERLSLHHGVSGRFTLVEVTAADAQATLYRASGALSALAWDIHSARLSLFRGRSVASFYVTGAADLSEAEARRALLKRMPEGGA